MAAIADRLGKQAVSAALDAQRGRDALALDDEHEAGEHQDEGSETRADLCLEALRHSDDAGHGDECDAEPAPEAVAMRHAAIHAVG